MSIGMQVYLVNEAEVKAVAGSGDDVLFKWLRFDEDGEDSLAPLDEELVDEMEDECPGFTHADALADIIAGRVTRPEAGFVYAYAFEHVCGCFGDWVHDHFHRSNPELLTQLDKMFEKHGVSLRFWGGLVGRPPVPLPDVSDSPMLGHWTESEVVSAAPAFRAMRAVGPHGEVWFEEMLDEVGAWLEKVAAKPGSMLVASYR